MNPTRGGWLIFLSLVGTMWLAVAALPAGTPDWLAWLRPDWAVAAFFFWAVTAPKRVGMFSAWFVGLFFDALLGPSYGLGLHGAFFAATVAIGKQFQLRLQLYNVMQQAAILAAIVLCVGVAKGLLRSFAAGIDFTMLTAVTGATTMLVYPLLVLLLRPLADRYVR